MAQLVKNPPATLETWVQFLGWDDPLEKGKATRSRILFWPGEFHGLYSPWGRKESDRTEQLSLSRGPGGGIVTVCDRCSGCGAWAPHMWTQLMQCRLSCSAACGILVSWPGIELASPALEGGFLNTGPQGTSPEQSFLTSKQEMRVAWESCEIAETNSKV